MRVSRISLADFRSYTSLDISLEDGLHVFMGRNAQGKTNILESVFLCCLGKSHRTSRDAEMIRREQKQAYVCVDAVRRDGPRRVEVLMESAGRKRIKVSDAPIRRMSELMGHMQCVMFSPEDLYLIKGGPGQRRKFLDVALCQLRPAYFLSLTKYNAVLAQRNAVLRGGNTQVLDTYDLLLAQYGAAVAAHRRQFVEQLAPEAADVHKSVAHGEDLHISYRTQAEEQETLLDLLAASREDDIRRGMTSQGPHRDELLVTVDGKDSRVYASQGQQRTAALALKLAGAARMERETGEKPIIMLDDVMSELDPNRQSALLERVQGQCLITTANELKLPRAHRFLVQDGRVKNV